MRLRWPWSPQEPQAVDYDDDGYWHDRGFVANPDLPGATELYQGWDRPTSYVKIQIVDLDGELINPEIHALAGDTVTIRAARWQKPEVVS